MERILNLDEIVSSADPDEVVEEVLSSGDFDATRDAGSVLPYLRKVSIDQIVPLDMQNRLMQLDITLSNAYFQIGDCANELVNSVNRQRSKELGKLISQLDIFSAIGYFCHRTSRSVRYYWNTASYFPQEIRNKFDVPFNIFAMARWVDNWELMLTIASENPQYSAAHVRAEYYKLINQEVPVREEVSDKGVEIGSADIPQSTISEVEVPKYKAVLLSQLDHTVDSLRAILDKIPLPTTLRMKIGEVLLEIQDIEIEIRREM
jgi:hypothetical protein